MIDYHVKYDKEHDLLLVEGPFAEDSVPIAIPLDNPYRKDFIDLFLHKQDIERGIEFLNAIRAGNGCTINEALFIAALNNCMKCFKYSKARIKLDKNIVFSCNSQLYNKFSEFETMRDKHFDHDENNMLQATAYMLVCKNGKELFGGPPSVVWTRAKLDYCAAGNHLLSVMRFVQQYLSGQIDAIGTKILRVYNNVPKETLLNYQVATINAISSGTTRIG